MFLQNCKYIQRCWIQSVVVNLAQPPCCSIILAAHLQKTDVKTSQEDLKGLRWHVGRYRIFSEMVRTVKGKKSRAPHFSAETKTSGYSVTVYRLYSFFFLVLGYLFLCQSSPKCFVDPEPYFFSTLLSDFFIPNSVFLWHILTLSLL